MHKLYLNYFRHQDNYRHQEIDYCVLHNINNVLIDKIYIILESKDDYFDWLDTDKTEIIYMNHRPTYKDYFELANKYDNDDIHILCNIDIFFGKTLEILYENMKNNYFIALTRWDADNTTQTANFFNTIGSQDSWIWKGKTILDDMVGEYCIGIPGCDNAICGELYKSGYKVMNPSIIIKTYHLHNEKERHYSGVLDKDFYYLKPIDNFDEEHIRFWKHGLDKDDPNL